MVECPPPTGAEERAEFDPMPSSARDARDFLRGVLDAWDCDDPDEIAVLLTSEVVSNAVLHAATSLAMDVRLLQGEVLRIEVRDGDPSIPQPRSVEYDATGGRGLFLVDALARRWGAEPDGDGKVVWFELDARRPAI